MIIPMDNLRSELNHVVSKINSAMAAKDLRIEELETALIRLENDLMEHHKSRAEMETLLLVQDKEIKELKGKNVNQDKVFERCIDQKDAILAKQQAEIERLNDKMAERIPVIVAPEMVNSPQWREISPIFELMRQEMVRAFEKHPNWPTDPIHAAAILAEECGELVQAANDFFYEKHWNTQKMAPEAVQCGAMAIRFLLNLDSYTKSDE